MVGFFLPSSPLYLLFPVKDGLFANKHWPHCKKTIFLIKTGQYPAQWLSHPAVLFKYFSSHVSSPFVTMSHIHNNHRIVWILFTIKVATWSNYILQMSARCLCGTTPALASWEVEDIGGHRRTGELSRQEPPESRRLMPGGGFEEAYLNYHRTGCAASITKLWQNIDCGLKQVSLSVSRGQFG